MSVDSEKAALIEQIRQSSDAPWANAERSNQRFAAMDLEELKRLHGHLVALSARQDLVRQTPETLERRKQADAKLAGALDQLKTLKSKASSVDVRRKEAEPAVAPVPKVGRIKPGKVRLNTSLRNWYEERYRWIDREAAAHAQLSASLVLQQRLLKAHRPKDEVEGLMRAVLDSETNATIRKIFEVSQLEVGRILRNRLVHELAVERIAISKTTLASFAEANIATAFEPVILPETSSALPLPRAMEGLAKLQAYAIDYDADVVYVPDKGSQIVGQFIVAELKSHRQSDAVLWRKGGGAPTVKTSHTPRYLYVADVADEFDQFARFQRRIHQEHGGKAQVKSAVLVSSTKLYEELYSAGDALVTHVAHEATHTPPWDRSGAYVREEESHIFGAGSDKPLSIPVPFIDPGPFLEELAGTRQALAT